MKNRNPAFSAVLIKTRPGDDKVTSYVQSVISEYCMENQLPWKLNDSMLSGRGDLLIVAVGGDGTMLGAMRDALQYDNPIVYGVNTGTLGFLSEDIGTSKFYRPTELKEKIVNSLNDVMRRNGMIEERMLLQATLSVGGDIVNDNLVAVNEFVLAPSYAQHPLVVEVEINNNFVSSNLGSGVLVSTATGSTAMALSGGGAIVSPSTNIIQIVPILAHTLTNRPIITTGRDTITLKAPIIKGGVDILADGMWLHSADEPVTLTIKKNPQKVKLFRPIGWNFFNVLREKMKW